MVAVWFQALLSIAYVLTGTFESVLLYCGFILQLSAALTVAGVFILRKKESETPYFKAPFHPLLPVIFILFSIWILVYLILDKPLESMIGMLILAIGVLTYFINKRISKSS